MSDGKAIDARRRINKLYHSQHKTSLLASSNAPLSISFFIFYEKTKSQSETDRKHHEKQLEERQVRIDTSSQELVEVRSKLDAEREKLSTAIEQRAMLEGELNALKDKEKIKGKAEK